MVKIKLSLSRKKYLKGKRVYQHTRGHLPVPSKILQKLKPYLKEDFQAEITDSDRRVALIYTHWKKPQQTSTTAPSDRILVDSPPQFTHRTLPSSSNRENALGKTFLSPENTPQKHDKNPHSAEAAP
jgi:hypothetical protein